MLPEPGTQRPPRDPHGGLAGDRPGAACAAGAGRVRDGLRNAVYDPSQITEADVDAYYAPLRSASGMNAFIARMHQQVADERVARVHTVAARSAPTRRSPRLSVGSTHTPEQTLPRPFRHFRKYIT